MLLGIIPKLQPVIARRLVERAPVGRHRLVAGNACLACLERLRDAEKATPCNKPPEHVVLSFLNPVPERYSGPHEV
jgi:hypothetical protein